MTKVLNRVPIANFKTERLVVSHWTNQLEPPPAKAQLACDLMPILTPKVLAHLPPSLQVSQTCDAIDDWITERAAESAVLRITTKADANLIGLLILVDVATAGKPPTIHMGYLFAETAWGQGFASEMLRGLLSKAQSVSPLSLVGGVARDNPASAHVLRKLEFQSQTNMSDEGNEVFTYSVTPSKGAPV